MKKHFWKIILGVAVLLLGASVVFSQYAKEKANEGVVISGHSKGNLEAAVTLTEYSDFQCPACGQFAPVLKEVMDLYGDKIRFEYKHFPLVTIHPYALPAARAAEAAAQQGKFWEMHDKLFEQQAVWSKGGNSDAFFIKYAEELGLDTALFREHLGASVITDAIKKSYSEGQALGLTGTPSLFLNGKKMSYASYEDFITQVGVAVGEVELTTPQSEATTDNSGVKFGI